MSDLVLRMTDVYRVHGTGPTAVRALVAAGRDPRFLVPEAVADYIARERLYRSEAHAD